MKDFLRGLGKLEKSFAILVLLYVFLAYVTPGSGFVALLQVVLVLLGFWLLIRVARVGMRRAIWRLRNRLLMTYVFIAVVPVLLIVLFVGVGTYALSSQLAVYLVSSELDRRVDSLNWVGHAAAGANPQQRMLVLHGVGEVLKQRMTDPSIVLRQRGVEAHWPENKPADPAPAGWGDANGILVRDGRFYAWAHVVRGDTDVTITAPLTRVFERSRARLGRGIAFCPFEQSPGAAVARGGGEPAESSGESFRRRSARRVADALPVLGCAWEGANGRADFGAHAPFGTAQRRFSTRRWTRFSNSFRWRCSA